MAGIGFELRRLFDENSIGSKVQGVVVASAVTIGPVLLVISSLMFIQTMQNHLDVSYMDKELLANTILYVFIFALLVIAPLDSALSRYISDRIFENDFDGVIPAYYVGICIDLTIASVMGTVFSIFAVVVGGVSPVYMLWAFFLFIAVVLTFYSMTFTTALKEYKQIFWAFLMGMFIAICSSVILIEFLHVGYAEAILYSYTIGFGIIALRFHTLVNQYFTGNDETYKKVLKNLWKYKALIVCNFSYILGLYIHNFIFWNGSLRVEIHEVFVSAPLYDMASCIAMFTNISVLVIFVVQVETTFFEKYQKFGHAINRGNKASIDVAHKIMYQTLAQQISYIIGIQALISVPIFLVAQIVLPSFGYGGLFLSIYPTLCAAYFVTFIMYMFIIFLYYFDDKKGACYVCVSFLVVTFLVSLVTVRMQPQYYGMGLFIGAFIGWTIAFFRIRYVAERFTSILLCRGTMIKKRMYKDATSNIVINENATRK